jgi:hypothetical protein
VKTTAAIARTGAALGSGSIVATIGGKSRISFRPFGSPYRPMFIGSSSLGRRAAPARES